MISVGLRLPASNVSCEGPEAVWKTSLELIKHLNQSLRFLHRARHPHLLRWTIHPIDIAL